MKQVFQYMRGGLAVEEVPRPVVHAGGVLVRNVCSLVSAGTERAAVVSGEKSVLGRAIERPDLVQQVVGRLRTSGLKSTYNAVMDRLDAAVALGYSSAGVVVEVGAGATEFTVGRAVACGGGGYANHAEYVFVPVNLCEPIPLRRGEGQCHVSFEDACFTTVGAIATQGVRQSEAALGEHVTVIGLGLVGLLTVQILKAAGCTVTGIDLNPARVELAKSLGAEQGIIGGVWDEHGSQTLRQIHAATNGRGADAVIITAASGSSDPVQIAGAISRDRGRVVIVGDVHVDVPRDTFYGREIELRFSRSYGPGRYDSQYEEKGIDYPIGYVRWTEKRNMEAFLALLAAGKVNVQPLITHRFCIGDAERAYQSLTGKAGEAPIGIVLSYGEAATEASPCEKPVARERRIAQDAVGIGFAGAGAFAKDVLLPRLAQMAGVCMQTVVTSSAATATTVARRYKFVKASCDYDEVLRDATVDAVFITTRHHLHASMALDALAAGKHVFLEKPMCLHADGLAAFEDAIFTATARGQLFMLGFNRRFAPASMKLRELFASRTGPLSIVYRINAGEIPAGHWTQDPEQGGGRIIGEACHFVDLAGCLVGAPLLRVAAEPMGTDGTAITLRYEDGSVATIQYITCGGPGLAKERLEVFGEGGWAVIDDFVSAQWGGTLRAGKWRAKRQDKGYAAEIAAFIDAVRTGSESPVPAAEVITSTRATFAVLESMRTGKAVELGLNHSARLRDMDPMEQR